MAKTSDSRAPKEIVTIQALRAVAAVLVIFAHLSEMRPLWSMGYVGVDIFFTVSGFVMLISTQSLRTREKASSIFLRRRFVRIFPMYWLVTALVIAYTYHHGYLYQAIYVVHSLLLIPYRSGAAADNYFPILAVGWTLTYEVFFYLLFAATLKLRRSPFWLAPVFVLLSLIGFHSRVQSVAVLSLFNYLLLEFVAGMFFAWLYVHRRVLPWKYAVVFCSVCVGCFAYAPKVSGAAHFFLGPVASVLLVYGCLSFEPFIVRHMPRVVEVVADASYSIYLCHQQLIAGLQYHYPGINAGGHVVPLLEIVLCCCVGIAVHYFVERPILRRFKVWIGGHAPA